MEPEAGGGWVEERVERRTAVAALYGAGTLVGEKDVGAGVSEARDGGLVDVGERVVLGAALAGLHAADAGDGVTGGERDAAAGREVVDALERVDGGEGIDRGAIGRNAAPVGEGREVGEAFVVAVNHDDRAREAEAVRVGLEDGVEPRGRGRH